MRTAQSADGLRRATRVRAVLQPARFTAGQKLLLLGVNAWPFLHLTIGVVGCLLPFVDPRLRATAAALWLFLLPPIACRIVVGRGLPRGTIAVPSAAFFRWWTTWQLQMLFNRLPWIEEALRFVPGLYSLWLRLWGARIGRLTLWSPGVRIYDRPLLNIGDDVVVGMEARITGHFGGINADGQADFTLGMVTIGDRTTIGGGAWLAPGVTLDADQATEALFLGTPFTRWSGGERQKAVEPLSFTDEH
jgi:hypothetical protein